MATTTAPNGLSGHWSFFSAHNSPLPTNSFASSLAAGKRGRVWMDIYVPRPGDIIADPFALVLTDGVNWSQHRFGLLGLPDRPIGHIAVDHHERVWLTNDRTSICCFDGQSVTIYEYGQSGLPKENGLVGLCVDGAGRVWAAMLNHGIYQFSNSYWSKITDCGTEASREYLTNCGLDGDSHLCIVCFDSKGADFLSLSSGKWELLCSFSKDSRYVDIVNSFIIDRRKRVWVGTEHLGLLVWEDKRWHRLSTQDCPLADQPISSMTLDEFDNLWVGTSSGFAIFDGARWHIWGAVLPESDQEPVSIEDVSGLKEEMRSRYVYVGFRMAIDSLGRKWIRSREGVVLFSPQASSVQCK